MSAKTYGYFDESYFQDGSKRGTAYVNYKEGARNSDTFKELARAIKEVFGPQRVLDIGCATGVTVRRLNELGCEAHGIDVSEWAVRNAEHPNVRLASADALPYSNNFFDLVISCHSLEHLPDAVFESSLAEIVRVSSAFHFHLLPMVGTPPYDGDATVVREQLRKDPTHQQLHSKEVWLSRFKSLGCTQVDACILLKHENSTAELSIGQFLLKKTPAVNDTGILKRATLRNQRLFRDIQLSKMAEASMNLGSSSVGQLKYENRIWKDVETRLEEGEKRSLLGRTFQLVVIVDGQPCKLRFAAGEDIPGQPYANVGEFQLAAQPGVNTFSFTTDQLRTLRGTPDYANINHLALGGENENTEILFYFADECGGSILR